MGEQVPVGALQTPVSLLIADNVHAADTSPAVPTLHVALHLLPTKVGGQFDQVAFGVVAGLPGHWTAQGTSENGVEQDMSRKQLKIQPAGCSHAAARLPNPIFR